MKFRRTRETLRQALAIIRSTQIDPGILSLDQDRLRQILDEDRSPTLEEVQAIGSGVNIQTARFACHLLEVCGVLPSQKGAPSAPNPTESLALLEIFLKIPDRGQRDFLACLAAELGTSDRAETASRSPSTLN